MSSLEGALACPRCEQPLLAQGVAWACLPCQVHYPVRGGLPCLFAAPAAALGEWNLRFQRDAAAAQGEAARLRKQLAVGGKRLRAATRERMARAAECRARYAGELNDLMELFGNDRGVSDGPADLATLIALRTRLPPTQGVMTYAANIFRDWAWGDEENRASLAAVSAVMPAQAERLLVLGAGAGRLSYDVHGQGGSVGMTLALDINPLLGRIGAQLSTGGEIALHEFPLAPRSSREVAVEHRLRAPAPARAGLHFLLGDVHRPPVTPGSMDVVLTPWLVDIVDEDFVLQARRVNRLLKPTGRWISFGSLSFSGADLDARYGLEEVLAIVEEAGFAVPSTTEHEIPYLQSPHSRHRRIEQVLTISADKVREVGHARAHVALPDWLTLGEAPVPLSESFKLQAASTRIHAFLMSMIDGQRSIEEMAQLMEAQKLMGKADAREAIRGFLTRMYEESRQS